MSPSSFALSFCAYLPNSRTPLGPLSTHQARLSRFLLTFISIVAQVNSQVAPSSAQKSPERQFANPEGYLVPTHRLTSAIPSVLSLRIENGTIHGLISPKYTMRSELHKGPPPDIGFPCFEVTYYDKPASAGITAKATDARSRRWPDSSQSFHNDGSINGLKPSSEDTQHQWRQKPGELLTNKFLLIDNVSAV